MNTSFVDRFDKFQNALVEFVWQQWCELGVAGAASSHLAWLIDPEPLVLFSLDVARQDPRVFDEILDWLLKNGEWINVQRLVTILRADGVGTPRLMQAVAATITACRCDSRWKQIVRLERSEAPEPEPLFRIGGRPWDPGVEADATFLKYGFRRSPVSTRGLSSAVSTANPRGVAFKTRALFGVSVRADVIAYLVTSGKGHPSQISRLLGFSQKQVQDILVEMARSGLVHVQHVGRQKDYSVAGERWCQFLFGSDTPPVQWVDWRALTRGLSILWRGIIDTVPKSSTNYVASSMARRAMRGAREDLLRCGIDISMEDDRAHHGEAYLEVFLSDLRKIAARLLSLPRRTDGLENQDAQGLEL